MRHFLNLTFTFCLTLFVIACSVNPVSGNQDFVLFSEEREIEIGRTFNAQILNQERIYPDQELQDYVQKVGESLSNISHRSNLVYRFTILDSPDVNAFALPGGYIFIYRGLLSYLSTEDELAAVLGHELGHVTARHGVTQASKAQVLDLLSYVVGSKVGSSARNVATLAGGAFLAGYGRDLELQADSLGSNYMSKAGYSSQGMMQILTVLKEQELYSKEVSKRRGTDTQTYHGVFSSHPTNDERLKEIIGFSKSSFEINSQKRTRGYLDKIDGMIYGDSEAAGVRRRNSFYHGELDFSLTSPKKWEIINSPSSLVFSSPQGKASMSLTVIDKNRKEPPLQYLRRVSPGEILEDELLNLSDLEGHTAVLNYDSNLHRVAIIFKDKQIFRFYGSALKQEDIETYDKHFLNIINSFSGLKESEKALTKPLKIKIYKVGRSDTYSSLAKDSPIPFDPEEKLRLLNGDYPDQELKVGRFIKLVE